MRAWASRGNASGAVATTARNNPQAKTHPAAPPARLSSRLSVNIWRARRPRPAPSAARIASSFRRAAARASMRLATLAQASATSASTAPNNNQDASFTS
jgi:hypothetical protein